MIQLDEKTFSIYPNPTFATLTLEFPQVISGSFQLIDVAGQIHGMDKFSNQSILTINIEAIPTGIYFINVRTEAGLNVQKVMKL